MTIEETRRIVTTMIKKNFPIRSHESNKSLIVNSKNYQIRPDEAFYYKDRVFIVEYEKNKRPVESISKYHWLLKRTSWLTEGFDIHLLFIICSEELEKKYPIRTESVELLGTELSQEFQDRFSFCFLNYSDLTLSRLVVEMEKYSNGSIFKD